MNETENEKSNLTKGEIVAYSFAALFLVAGLFFIILAIIGDHLPVKYDDNWIIQSSAAVESWSKLGYRWWGLIFFSIGVLIGCISLSVFAGKSDRDTERVARRSQRLAINQASAPNGAIEATVTEKPAADAAKPEVK